MAGLHVLVTRPGAQGQHTAARLKDFGHRALLAPVLTIRPSALPPPAGPFDALLLTSANAAPGLDHPALPPGLLVLCVGDRTAAAAVAHRGPILTAHGDAAALAELAARHLPPGSRLLHLAGRDRKPEPARSLEAAGYAVAVWEAYAAEATDRFPPGIADALPSLDAALHYSRRSAEVLLGLAHAPDLRAGLLGLRHLALSEDVAAPLREAGAAVIVAARPREPDLLRLLDGVPA